MAATPSIDLLIPKDHRETPASDQRCSCFRVPLESKLSGLVYTMAARSSAVTLASELASEEVSLLLTWVRPTPAEGRVLEVGTAAGGTLCQMMKCFPDAQRPKFVVVDPMSYFPNQVEIVRQNLRQHDLDPAEVDLRVARSNEAFQQAQAAGETYDFILIDAAHKIRYVTQDLCWTRLLKVGGVICLHDYNSRHKGVLWSADRFLRKHRNYRRQALVNTLLLLKKNAASLRPEIDERDRLWAALLSPCLQLESSLRKRLARSARSAGFFS